MYIEIQKLHPDGEQLVGTESSTLLEVGPILMVKEIGTIGYDFFVQLVGSELIVQGQLSMPVELECSRCAGFFSTKVCVSSFLHTYSVSKEMDRVDLTEDIREDLLLAIPAYPYCDEKCRGLCQKCGKNLNRGACKCRQSLPDMRLGALDDLNIN